MALSSRSSVYLSLLVTSLAYFVYPYLSGEGRTDSVLLSNDSALEFPSMEAWNAEFDLEDFHADSIPEITANLTANNKSSDEDPDMPAVVIDGCPGLKFKPIPYQHSNRAQDFFQLKLSTVLTGIVPDYDREVTPGCGSVKKPQGFGREHIYEVQLIAAFIVDLIDENPDIYQQWPGETRCSYIGKYILKPATPNAPIKQLLQCLPHSTTPFPTGAYMPWLDNLANGMKASAFSGKSLRQKAKFTAELPTKQVMIMRAVAGLMAYMTHADVETSFVQQSKCIREVWEAWLAAYIAAGKANPMKAGGDMATFYNKWVTAKVEKFETNIKTGLDDMIKWWKEKYQQTIPMVKFDYSCNFSKNSPTPSPVNAALVDSLATYVANHPLSWVPDLSK